MIKVLVIVERMVDFHVCIGHLIRVTSFKELRNLTHLFFRNLGIPLVRLLILLSHPLIIYEETLFLHTALFVLQIEGFNLS